MGWISGGSKSETTCRVKPALDGDVSRINIRILRVHRSSSNPALAIPQRSRIMMMAHDSSQNPPSRLSDDTTDSVRVALREYLATGSSSELQHALLLMAADAREKSMPPEQVLIALKDIWNALPEVRAMTDAGNQIRLLQRVVTMCIKEYYSA